MPMSSVNPVQFAEVVPMGAQFGLEAAPDFPMEDRMADTEEALLGRLVKNFNKLPEGTVIDVELVNHNHITFTNETEQGAQPSPAAA